MIPPLFVCRSGRWVGTVVDSRCPGSHFYMETAKTIVHGKDYEKNHFIPLNPNKIDPQLTSSYLDIRKCLWRFLQWHWKEMVMGKVVWSASLSLTTCSKLFNFVNFQEHIAGHCQLGKGSVPERAPKANGSLVSWKVCH